MAGNTMTPPPLPIYLLNNNDDNGFPIVGNEATGNLFGPTFPRRGTCVVRKKTTAVVAQVECEPPAVALVCLRATSPPEHVLFLFALLFSFN